MEMPKNKKTPKGNGKSGPGDKGKNKSPIPGLPGGLPPAGKLFSNILTTVLVFLIIATIYSAIAGNGTKVETVSISKIAEDVNSGTVKSIVVSGGDITVQ